MAFASSDVPQNVDFAIKPTIALNVLEANGVEPPITVRTTGLTAGTAVAAKTRDLNVQIACY